MSKLRSTAAVALAGLLAACGGDGGDPITPPSPASIVAVQGDGQTGTVGQPAPADVVVEVRDQNGSALADVAVAFTVTGGGGSVRPASATTDGTGRATTVWTLGSQVGNQTLRAQAGDVSVVLSATAEAGDPATLTKVGGDDQSGPPGSTLPDPLAVRVTDDFGNPIPGFEVSFSASAGSVSPTSATTDADGTAGTRLTLPATEQSVTVTASGAGLASRTFNATSAIAPLQLQADLDRGRLTLAYEGALTASGGSESGFVFSIASGDLPPGLSMGGDGVVSGTPTQEGDFVFNAQVVDDEGGSTRREFTLTVCEAPLALAPGESVVMEPAPPSECGAFLPSGADGDLYRVGVVWRTTSEDRTVFSNVRLETTSFGGVSTAQEAQVRAPSEPRQALRRVGSDVTTDLRSMAEATRSFHMELRRQEREMLGRIGYDAVLPDRRDRFRNVPRSLRARASLPTRLRLDPSSRGDCSAGTEVTALRLAENEFMGVYQDSSQNAHPDSMVTAAEAQILLDFYADHNKEVVDAYYGGLPDINGDGAVVVFISPVANSFAGFVWSGNFLDESVCPGSNEMELIFLNQSIVKGLGDDTDGPDQGVSTLAHEVRHVTELFERLQRSNQMQSAQFQPLWISEGEAEVAAEVATRLAWSRMGGPAVNALLTGADFPQGTLTSDVILGPVIRLFRVQDEYLSNQPNTLTTADQATVRGAGWAFQRWFADAYGMAGTAPMADSALWRQMNEAAWPSGVERFEQMSGTSWEELLVEYYTAVMLNGTGAPQPERAFTTVDLVDAVEVWSFARDGQPGAPPGTFPWPVTVQSDGTMAVPFGDDVFQGSSGPSGIRVHDFASDGTGDGIEVNVEASQPESVVIVLRLR